MLIQYAISILHTLHKIGEYVKQCGEVCSKVGAYAKVEGLSIDGARY